MAYGEARLMWPTPRSSKTTNENEETWMKRKESGSVSTPPLSLAVKMYPTPAQRDYKGSRSTEQLIEAGRNPETNSLGDAVGEGNVDGQLNPDWVCWLMGFPIGWESLEQITELTLLDWSVDPADMEPPGSTPTPSATQRGGGSIDGSGRIHDIESLSSESLSGVRYGMNLQTFVKLKQSNGPIPRVATGTKDRVNRLKALGNGQVPLCAATAFSTLIGNNI